VGVGVEGSPSFSSSGHGSRTRSHSPYGDKAVAEFHTLEKHTRGILQSEPVSSAHSGRASAANFSEPQRQACIALAGNCNAPWSSPEVSDNPLLSLPR